jgi:hypothetical protein
MLTADYAFVGALLVVIACNLYFAPRIRSDKIAMQWGLDGKPTWYAPRWLGLWGVIPFMLAVRFFIWAAVIYTPQYVHGVDPGILGFSVAMVVCQLYILSKAAKADEQ